VSNLTGHNHHIIDNAFVGNDLLASSSFDQTIRCWNLTTNTLKFTQTGHTNQVWGLKVISFDTLATFDTSINHVFIVLKCVALRVFEAFKTQIGRVFKRV
jgi:WD40 repeat protein